MCAVATEATCRSEDALLASLGRQVQPESSVAGVHRSVDYAAGPILLHEFRILASRGCPFATAVTESPETQM